LLGLPGPEGPEHLEIAEDEIARLILQGVEPFHATLYIGNGAMFDTKLAE